MAHGSNPPTPGVRSFVANGVRCFPTELLYEVITLTLSRYLSDVLIAPTSTRSWDAIGALLHVDYQFRCCTLTVLDALWDGTFMDRKSGCVSFVVREFWLKVKERKPPTKLHSQDRIFASSCRTRKEQSTGRASPRAPRAFYAPEYGTVRASRTPLRCVPSAGKCMLNRSWPLCMP